MNRLFLSTRLAVTNTGVLAVVAQTGKKAPQAIKNRKGKAFNVGALTFLVPEPQRRRRQAQETRGSGNNTGYSSVD